ncbi:MAG: hypothetical protein CGU28_03470 [Candidatus Dactylopiibacterium carminicum]|uniref:DUF2917 domain-containing protein n=1 Tax=Candidatus Dactylopiibacterium carminicum TaxID=857335 RepID=A0A272EZM3_9RHOO|nr:DUF2917 domain-containing protein [Candidatus Dactylopiibacterium carminicum]KAF7600459.1 DUF2917 domain-containing protein [Candidatus Dactylopiibacterium carminicum]PAS95080.1 MAG: hypothetical protein CGU29_01115 [Candidatus Dactylopiibacterium carminicum]PAS97813.1 MAG: hypothetical protein CGU28_03470 [Candidatus Dactylopiibacterium carminicum]PAT00457.1 MAG: hypothetical protein BSR46_02650 [Candidatus Dactylopiibacterium carminicum]
MTKQLTIVVSRKLCVLELPADSQLRLLSGKVWLTETGRPEDFVLEAGAEHRTRNAGKLLLDAQDEARVEIRPGIDESVKTRPLDGIAA